VTRWHVLDYRRHWPIGAWRQRWDIAYPRAFWDLLDRYAKKRGHPTELQIAFVREESAFNPGLESWANAIGLTQMIFPTARQYGRGTGIRITRANLRDPEKNVIIGSRFLEALLKRYNNQVALAVPAYNAGPARLDRWRRDIGEAPQDVFAEALFGDQAREYAKRVIGTYFAYSYLETGTVPEIPLTLR
jgi:soluble lytic murein transglycosylase